MFFDAFLISILFTWDVFVVLRVCYVSCGHHFLSQNLIKCHLLIYLWCNITFIFRANLYQSCCLATAWGFCIKKSMKIELVGSKLMWFPPQHFYSIYIFKFFWSLLRFLGWFVAASVGPNKSGWSLMGPLWLEVWRWSSDSWLWSVGPLIDYH